MKNLFVAIALTGILFFSCEKDKYENEQVEVIKANGNIQDEVDAFKASLGTLNNTPNVSGGHREINWDGVPDSLLNKPLPADFFNQTASDASAAMQRGITYSPGNFVVSDDGFASVNNEASSEFSSFSGDKAFANTTSVLWDVKFEKAGTEQEASVQSFGAVFSDVDEDNSTSMEFFDGETSLGKFFVPAHDAASSFSFLGITAPAGKHITKVTVSHDGFLAEGGRDISQGGSKDLIVLDDFIYSEPVAL